MIAENLYYVDNPNKKLADENMICQKAKGRSIQHFRLREYYNPITLINSIQVAWRNSPLDLMRLNYPKNQRVILTL